MNSAMTTLRKPVDNRIVVVVFIFLISVVLLGLTFYTINLTYQINDTIAEKATIAADLQRQVTRLRSIQEKDAQIEHVVRQAYIKIPPVPDEAGIIEYIKSITEGGTLTGITFDKRVDRSVATEMPMTITVISSYGEMLDVILALATAERYFTISSVNIDKTADGELSYTINASAYYNPSAAISG